MDDALALVNATGTDGLIVMDFMMAESLDDCIDTELAEVELARIKAL